jgi:hypothetical protein
MPAQGLELDFGFNAASRLPPPRAARTPRSRGFFLKAAPESKKPRRKWGKSDFSIIAFAVAVVALTSALIVGAPSAMLGSAVSLNPGPAMVGATSVAPAFFTPPKAR